MRYLSVDARRARLGARHGLAKPFDTVEDVVGSVFGLHSSDPATVYLSCRARLSGFASEDLEAALYDRRSLVRMLGMRRTLFVVSPQDGAVMDSACTRRFAPSERRRLAKMLEEQSIAPDGEQWIEQVGGRVLESLRKRGEATASEITKDVPDLSAKLRFGEGRKWGGDVGVSTRVLFLLATDGVIVRGRPRGTWLSSQYRWALTDDWLTPPLDRLDTEFAQARLLGRYLAAFGPATFTDIRWWTGWRVRDVESALVAVGAEEVAIDHGTGYLIPGDDDSGDRGDWVALLPSLDSTVMGWKERNWYLGDHAASLFDRNGNAGPTVWVDGRVVGGWGQRSSGEVSYRLLEQVGSQRRAAIAEEAERLTDWLGDTRVTPRFRTPLDKHLASD